jgi:hypothetical protein
MIAAVHHSGGHACHRLTMRRSTSSRIEGAEAGELLAKCRRSDRSARILRYGRLQAGATFQAINSTAPLSSTILAGPLASCAYRALSHLWSAYHPNSRRSAGTIPFRFHNLSFCEFGQSEPEFKTPSKLNSLRNHTFFISRNLQ